MKYQEAEAGFWINEDPDLTPFWIDLRKLIEKNYRKWNKEAPAILSILNPPDEKIAGFGLDPQDQYWRRREMPKQLRLLIKDLKRRLESDMDEDRSLEDEIWSILAQNKHEYYREIEFIREEIYFCFFGYWIYINGKKTWIPPNHYFYLTYWEDSYEDIDKETGEKYTSSYPQFRDIDLRSECASLYFYLDTETFEKFDARGIAIPEEDGTYRMVDMGRRTFYGECNPKNRRGGYTQRSLARMYWITIFVKKAFSWITSHEKETSEDHWEKKLVPAWQSMPFYFSPAHQESTEPKSKIRFSFKGIKGKKKNIARPLSIQPLQSVLSFAPKVDLIYFDGKKCTGYNLYDEGGKNTTADVNKGWSIAKQSQSTGGGGNINKDSWSRWPSTVEEMEGGGGASYKLLCDSSNIYRRDMVNGQTMSGLAMIFFSAYDGLEGYIGKFGESIIDDPTPEQAEYIGKLHGSRYALDTKIEQLEKSPRLEDIIECQSYKRKYPRRYADCWRLMGGDLGYNLDKMNTRMEELSKMIAAGNDPRERGDVKWVVKGEEYSAKEFLEANLHINEDPDNYVVWRPNKNGAWYKSFNIHPNSTNRRRYHMGQWQPEDLDTRFIITPDPVGYQSKNNAKLRADKSKASYAAACVFYKYDDEVDAGKPMEEWESYRFIMSYMNKPQNTHWYEEECLMVSVMMGAECFPETNIDAIIDWFETRGYGGYLKSAYIIAKNDYKDAPGYQAGAGVGTKDNIFTEIGNHIEDHVMRERHIEIIDQWASIKAIEEMTKYDLFASSGGCLLGVKLSPKRFYTKPDLVDPAKINLSDYYF